MQLLDHNRVLPSKLRSTLNNRVIKLCFKHFDLKAEVLRQQTYVHVRLCFKTK